MEDIKLCDRVYDLCPECPKRCILWIETPDDDSVSFCYSDINEARHECKIAEHATVFHGVDIVPHTVILMIPKE